MAFRFTPEEEAHFQAREKRIADKRTELRDLSDEDLADRLEYCMANSSFVPKHAHADLVTYDDALVLTHLPELLRRLRGREEKPKYDELLRRIKAQKE